MGMTMTFFSLRGMHCSAAMMMFLLLGNTNTVEAGVRLISFRISSVEGFMVWPPVTMPSAPSSRNRSSMPLPAQTVTMPYSFSGSAMAGSLFSPSCQSSASSAVLAFLPALTASL